MEGVLSCGEDRVGKTKIVEAASGALSVCRNMSNCAMLHFTLYQLFKKIAAVNRQ